MRAHVQVSWLGPGGPDRLGLVSVFLLLLAKSKQTQINKGCFTNVPDLAIITIHIVQEVKMSDDVLVFYFSHFQPFLFMFE